VLPLLVALCLAQADPGLGAKWERRAPRDLDPAAGAPPSTRPAAPDLRSLPDEALEAAIEKAERGKTPMLGLLRAERERRALEREAEAADRRLAGEAAAEAAREAEARRRAAEEALRAEEEARAARLAAAAEEAAAREEARLAAQDLRREVAVGGGAVLVLVVAGGLAWRSLRSRGSP
jgi:membrane protein involved in colicin uptake